MQVINIINPEELRKEGYGEAAIESLELGLSIAIWDHSSEEAKQIKKDFPQYESFHIEEFPNGARYLYGSPDRTKIGAVLLKELPKLKRTPKTAE